MPALLNTTFGQMKINFLRKAGNAYNANDAVKLQMAGNAINDALQGILSEIKGHPYTLDTENTKNTTASQAYIDLSDTDIMEVYDVTQKTTNSKLRWIPYSRYKNLIPNSAILGGVPEALWTATQVVTAGQSLWRLYFVPTPSAAIAMYYDYVKNIAFTSDGPSADGEFCALPNIYDCWVEEEAKPVFYEMIDPKNTGLIDRAYARAEKKRPGYKRAILTGADMYSQAGSSRDNTPFIYKRVATTPPPSP